MLALGHSLIKKTHTKPIKIMWTASWLLVPTILVFNHKKEVHDSRKTLRFLVKQGQLSSHVPTQSAKLTLVDPTEPIHDSPK